MKVIRLQHYPLLKFLVPLALLVAAFGLYMFFSTTAADGSHSPMVLLPYLIIAALLAFGGLLWKKKENVVLMFPSDTLAGKSRGELQKLLDGLEASKAAGEMNEERYAKARAKVLEAMKGKK